ncbi:glycosyltransferase [Bradyrhizobium sediminis]|uniref:Glycosyltransferase n=1 Tax=Bradyrhizobium sediminis TaxID=2840469 RepID=A0A975RPI2_9BRAD|nr:glycosyltransferase [Bradyrhizobium sediminis]QWG14879.1 glycosyltransferase [Bradyrhizobium sediminis]
MKKLQLVHLSTVHPRADTRIFVKQVQTLFSALAEDVSLVVADGLGDRHNPGSPAIYDLGKLPGSRLKRSLAGNCRAFKFLRRAKPRLVHFHDPELIPLGLLLRLFGCQVVYDVHEDAPRQTMSKHWIPVYFRWPVGKAIAAMEWLAAATFSGIVAATPTIAARFPSAKTVLVQNFPIQSELVLAEPQPYDQRPNKFVYVGGIAEIRGVKEMVRALEWFSDQPEVTLQMAGEVSPPSFADELHRLPAWSKINYCGSIDRSAIARLFGSSRAGLVLLHPVINYLDALPVKMFEYMSAGLPVIASDFPLWREIVGGAECGLLVDPLNPKAIADALRWILEHPVEAEAMGKDGQKAVKDKYNWEQESKKLVGLYRDLLKTKQVKE